MLPFAMPPPVALARTATALPPRGVPMARFEPKFDGFRAVWGAGRLWSRRGTDLSIYFPDLLPALRHLPEDLVLDGELIAWNTETGRLDFTSLQQRLRAGRRLCDIAAARPVQMVCFDLLACAGSDLRGRELAARRVALEYVLAGAPAPVVLCEHTDRLAAAQAWLRDWPLAGGEGVVVKSAAGLYPIRPGQRVWHKVKARKTRDLVAVGIVGDPAAPNSLLLAAPGDPERVVGATTRLDRAAARALAPLLTFIGTSSQRRAAWASRELVEVLHIAPLVVEINADVAVDQGVLRHGARFVRARPDLDVSDSSALED
ncbi:MAG: ATP-dependent DNA ligase [Pseudonocardiales bacterium]|nr:MAG: ATP-dependent DNA ligase [Pseudonocardiales bacterium]